MKQIREKLIGSTNVFNLEARIYHSICIVAFLALAYNVPFNYYVGLPKVALISLAALIGFAGLYYLSRFRKKFNCSVLLLGILGHVFFAAVYFLNSGINGPSFILFALFFYLFCSIAPKQQQWLWLGVNGCVVTGIAIIQYLSPALVPDVYPDVFNRFTDAISAYLVVTLSLFFSLRHLRRNYETEKASAIHRALDIELKNIQLERINGEKNKLFSIVAHDLRSPLASIQSYLELLTSYPLEEAEKKEVELKLLRLTKNTSNMMANLLSWSKSQLEGVSVNLQAIELFQALRGMLEIERSIAREKNIELVCSIPEHCVVLADPDMLILVIRNLISNAIKFTPPGGTITVCSSPVTHCRITITDSGTGMDLHQQRNVFSLKAQSTFGTNNEKGVGLGLILCKEFIELQQGSISFTSSPGKGSSFTVTVPLADAQPALELETSGFRN